MRHCQTPRAGMGISGSGPNLLGELYARKALSGFPNPDLFDRFAPSGRRLLTPLLAPVLAVRHKHHAGPTSAGSLSSSFFVSIAQICRAILLASAIATSILGLRSNMPDSLATMAVGPPIGKQISIRPCR